MTLAEHDAEVQRLEGLISSKSAKISSLERSADSWEGPARARNCNKQGYHPVFQKKKITACEVEKKRQLGLAANYRKEAKAIKSQVDTHKKALQKLIDDRSKIVASSAEVSRLLAEQGKTQEAVRTSAELEGQAAAERQRMLGEAESMKVLQDAEADASNKKLIGLVGVGIGVVVIIVVGVIAYKKFKKK